MATSIRGFKFRECLVSVNLDNSTYSIFQDLPYSSVPVRVIISITEGQEIKRISYTKNSKAIRFVRNGNLYLIANPKKRHFYLYPISDRKLHVVCMYVNLDKSSSQLIIRDNHPSQVLPCAYINHSLLLKDKPENIVDSITAVPDLRRLIKESIPKVTFFESKNFNHVKHILAIPNKIYFVEASHSLVGIIIIPRKNNMDYYDKSDIRSIKVFIKDVGSVRTFEKLVMLPKVANLMFGITDSYPRYMRYVPFSDPTGIYHITGKSLKMPAYNKRISIFTVTKFDKVDMFMLTKF